MSIIARNESPGIYVTEIIAVSWRRRKLIFTCISLFLIAGIYLAHKSKPEFTATSKFICQGTRPRTANIGALASLAGIQTSINSSPDPSSYLPDIVDDDEFLEQLIKKNWIYQHDTLPLAKIWGLRPDTTSPNWHYVFLKTCVSVLQSHEHIDLSLEKENGVFVLKTKFRRFLTLHFKLMNQFFNCSPII